MNPEGKLVNRQTETGTQPCLYSGLRGSGINGDGSTGDTVRVHISQDHVGVGDGRFGSASAITGRSGDGTGAPGSDAQRATVVYPGQAAASCADLNNIVRRDAQRITGTLAQSPSPVDARPHLAFCGFNRLAIFDKAAFGGCSTHIKRHGLSQANFPGQAGRSQRAGRRTGFNHMHRPAAGVRGAHDPAVGLHDLQWWGISPQLCFQLVQVASDHGHEVGVQSRGGGAFVLADLGQDVG